MSLGIGIEGIADPAKRLDIETAIRECVGDPPGDEQWSIVAVFYEGSCTLLLKTPKLSRTKLLVYDGTEPTDVVRDWLRLYPMR